MSEPNIVKKLKEVMKRAEQINRTTLVVGIPKDKNKRKKNGGITNAELGVIHEFGATINHQGGTRYSKNNKGQTIFVSNSFVGPVSGITGAHQIVIPERSFMRSTLSEESKNLGKLADAKIAECLKGDISAHDAYATVGDYLQGKIVDKIDSGGFAPNKSATIKRKGSSKPLVDQGELRASIKYEVRDNES